MTPEYATDLGARTLAAIDAQRWTGHGIDSRAADRERVAPDLAVYREVYQLRVRDDELVNLALGNAQAAALAGLLRTAALYGVEP